MKFYNFTVRNVVVNMTTLCPVLPTSVSSRHRPGTYLASGLAGVISLRLRVDQGLKCGIYARSAQDIPIRNLNVEILM